MATVTVRINGMDYNLKGKEDEAYLKELASYVEDKLQEILSKNSKLSVSAASILTAINLADEAFKGQSELNEIQGNYENLKIANRSFKKELEELLQKQDLIVKNKEVEFAGAIKNLKIELQNAVKAKQVIELEKRAAQENKNILIEERNKLIKEKEELKTKVLKNNDELFKAKIEKLSEELELLKEENQNLKRENQTMKNSNKDLKFNLQTSKYKLIDLEKKFIESQISLAKEKAVNDPLKVKKLKK